MLPDVLKRIFRGTGASSQPSAPPATTIKSPAPRRVSLESISRSPTHPVLAGRDLLALLPRWLEIEDRIFRASKQTRDLFNALYLAPITAFAERVQFLPASQSNHHAGPLGQLEHTLEVIEIALAKRASMRLPLGAEPERVSRESLIWTYAVFVGALGHDAGRPIARFRVRAKIGNDWHNVSLWGESLHALGATEYAFSWVDGAYEFHNRVAQLMLARLLPSAGCAYLNQCPQALSELSAWLYGDQFNCGVIGEICRHADGQSVARNVGGALPGATVSESGIQMPVYKRAEMILRDLAREWVINGRAAKGATQTGGSDAWAVGSYIFVRSTVMNDLHTALVDAGVKGVPESAPGIVTKLADAGVALSYDDDGKKKAVFSIKIQTADGHTVSAKFTVLVFPIDHVFPLKNRPPQFDGTITVVSPELPNAHVLAQHTRKVVSAAEVNVTGAEPPASFVGGKDAGGSAVAIASSREAGELSAATPSGTTGADERSWSVLDNAGGSSAASGLSSDLPQTEQDALAFLRQAAFPVSEENLDEEEASKPVLDDAQPVAPSAIGADAALEQRVADIPETGGVLDDVAEPVGATLLAVDESENGDESADANWSPLNDRGDYLQSAHAQVDPPIVRAFFAWLHDGMNRTPDATGIGPAGTVVEMNTRTALVHGASELPGCLGLVTPKAFREFLADRPYQFEANEFETADGYDAQGSFADELQLQSMLRGSRWAVHNGLAPGQNVFTYRIDTGEERKGGALNLVMLSEEAGRLVLPAGMRWVANPMLKRSTPEEIAEARAAKKNPKPAPRAFSAEDRGPSSNHPSAGKKNRKNKNATPPKPKKAPTADDILGFLEE